MVQSSELVYYYYFEEYAPKFASNKLVGDTGFVNLDGSVSVESAVRKYFAHKCWAVKYLDKIEKLTSLLEKQYDRQYEEKLNIILTKGENENSGLSQVAEFLKQKKDKNVTDLQADVSKFEIEIEEAWDIFNKTMFVLLIYALLLFKATAGSNTALAYQATRQQQERRGGNGRNDNPYKTGLGRCTISDAEMKRCL